MRLEAKTEAEMRDAPTPWPKSMEDLKEYIESCLAAINAPANADHEDMGDAYGRCVYAMSLAALAAFNYVAHVEGVTGFQAACADMDILRRTRGFKGGFGIIDYSQMLYPQYDLLDRVKKAMEDDEQRAWLRKEAKKLLEEQPHASEKVLEHWKKLAA